MRKLISVALILQAVLSCLTACNFTQNLSGTLADEAEATSQVEKMMMALAQNRTSDAEKLMHPQASEKSGAAMAQMSDFLAGRTVVDMELRNINVKTSTGTSGKIRQEEAAYQVTLTDGTVIYLNVVYLSNPAGIGFTAFQLVLGIV